MPAAAAPAARPYCARPGCTNRLKGKQVRYCGNSCRATHANMKRTAEERALVESETLEQIREKVAPAVREMLTDKVLSERKVLTELIPDAIETLKRIMVDRDADADLQLKAATLLLRYTMGNSSIAPAPAEQDHAPLQVIIGGGIGQQAISGPSEPLAIPPHTPGAEIAPSAPAADEAPPLELRECLECREHRPIDSFVYGSHRCQGCHDKMLARVRDRFGSDVVDPR